MKEIIHYATVLMIIAGIAGISLHGVNQVTREKIKEQEREKLLAGQTIAYPRGTSYSEPRTFPADGKSALYYEVLNEDKKVIGYELQYTVQGYQSQVTVLTGITPDGTVTGIKVLSQAETPGLGAEVEAIPSTETLWQAIAGLFRGEQEGKAGGQAPAFQAQFRGKTVEQLKVVKQKTDEYIEAISGATITSEAVTRAVREPIEAFLKHQQERDRQ